MPAKEKKMTGKEIVDFYLEEGFSLRDIEDFLCDGGPLHLKGLLIKVR